MIITAAVILVLTLLFTGIGLLFPWSAYKREQNVNNLLTLFWIGWALTIAFLQIWHLAAKIGGLALLVVLLAGTVGWARWGRLVLAQARGWMRARVLGLAALALLACLVLANQVMFATPPFDHGLYHLPTIQWLTQYAIVPGLGNLHHRLAFNNSNFLYAALFDWGPLAGRAYLVANSLPAFVLLVQCGAGFYQMFFDKAPAPAAGQAETHRPAAIRPQLSHLFFALMLPVSLWQFSQFSLPGYSPDLPVYMLHVVLAGALLRLFESGRERERFLPVATEIILIAATGISVKLSFAVSGGLFLLAAGGLWLARFGWRRRTDRAVLVRWGGLAALLLVPWMARQVILSGYLIFPGKVLPFPVVWRMPDELVDPIAPIISLWARSVNSTIPYTGDLAWFQNWSDRFLFPAKRAFQFGLLFAALDLLLAWALRKKTASAAQHDSPAWACSVLFIVSGLSLVYWFVMAPDYRFSGAMFWIFLAAPLLYGYSLLVEGRLASAPLFLAVALVMGLTIWLSPNHFSNNLSRAWLVLPPREQQLVQREFEPGQLKTRRTHSGLVIYSPPDPVQACFDAPLPCAPPQDFYPRLGLIVPGNLQKGFFIEPE